MSNLRQLQDFWFKEAKRLGFVARSALKLQEIQDKHRVIGRGGDVLDLGCSPGAWLQVACRALGPPAAGGTVIGVDLKDVVVPTLHCDGRVRALRGDALGLTPAALRALSPRGFSAVLSDMCPDTTGAAATDAARSARLAHAALALALGDEAAAEEEEEGSGSDGANEAGVLRPGGALVVKLLEGPGGARQALAALCKGRFARVAWVRPRATRPESRETFLVATGRRRAAPKAAT